ncbi:hypothetical protein PY650_14900 [Rhizobium calliandrae]|uniref:ABM domain-containing protein n=2 Tax=Rhizobium TaxID=379 RepID=A0A387FXW2_9HYPH|nr:MULTISPECIES: hypothetical protein [Rhizobium]AYG59956.1 hypothetical protein CCGE525_14920 [Rhizobium jaguaris]MDL2406926.1 hypothetical protein [Rhizobium calliandrae]
MIEIVATVRVRRQRMGVVLRYLEAVVEPVRLDPDCLHFGFVTDALNPPLEHGPEITIVIRWASKLSLETRRRDARIATFLSALGEHIAVATVNERQLSDDLGAVECNALLENQDLEVA